ncbi:MAG: 30S ribosomal protein S20 [Bdellovibrionaceae bacterium]|nr:30S ribosomal protein S20 [Pseudobdellovibrionaceae bacterium]
MANHKSSVKRTRQTIKKQARNHVHKKEVGTFEKKLRAAISEKASDTALSLLKVFSKKINTAAQKGLFHQNKVARKVSRLAKQVNSLS